MQNLKLLLLLLLIASKCDSLYSFLFLSLKSSVDADSHFSQLLIQLKCDVFLTLKVGKCFITSDLLCGTPYSIPSPRVDPISRKSLPIASCETNQRICWQATERKNSRIFEALARFFCVYYFNLIPLCVHSLCGTTSLSLSLACLSNNICYNKCYVCRLSFCLVNGIALIFLPLSSRFIFFVSERMKIVVKKIGRHYSADWNC